MLQAGKQKNLKLMVRYGKFTQQIHPVVKYQNRSVP
jgi:hypothetical protein